MEFGRRMGTKGKNVGARSLRGFRASLYALPRWCPDDLFELTDAILAAG